MKTTIDLPDQLMDEVENLAAREQRNVSEVVTDLVRAGLQEHRLKNGHQEKPSHHWQQMLDAFALADELLEDAPPSPTARELLEEDRNRLERS